MRACLPAPIALALDSVVALAAMEIEEGLAADFADALGLDAGQLAALGPCLACPLTSTCATDMARPSCDDEIALRELLHRACIAPEPVANLLPAIVARRAMREDHLWQDLGLPHRAALGQLMATAFPSLHAANDRDMKWKRFFYRSLCEADGFSLCAAPHCRDCTDFERCFGAEDGQSAFARRLRAEPSSA